MNQFPCLQPPSVRRKLSSGILERSAQFKAPGQGLDLSSSVFFFRFFHSIHWLLARRFAFDGAV